LLLFRFLVSVFYSKAKIAAACSGIIYLLTYVPCMYISIREDLAQDTIPKWAKMLAVSLLKKNQSIIDKKFSLLVFFFNKCFWYGS